MTVIRRPIVMAVFGAALFAGCAAGSPVTPSTGPAGGDTMSVWRHFAACARLNGVPGLPDPVLDSTGHVSFPGYNVKAEPDAVRSACQPILAALPPDPHATSGPPTDIHGLLLFAGCMRTHSFPHWPDPKADGTFPSGQLPSMKTPSLIAAMGACDHLNPDRGGHVYGS